jgi:hypothetical protein
MREVDKALFLVGETSLTAGEVIAWAAELGYPVTGAPVGMGAQLVVARADAADGWRS